MAVNSRSARSEDQQVIVSFIQQARINPRNLQGQNFLIAEENGQIVGIRQVKVHAQGSREVASGFVLPEYRRQGISAVLMKKILAREKDSLYLMCNKKRKPYYEQFGFPDVKLRELPGDFLKEHLIGKMVTTLISILTLRPLNIVPMRRGSNRSG
jgi:N-acetylglutamate synthase-like GNAT family acetyltransferase